MRCGPFMLVGLAGAVLGLASLGLDRVRKGQIDASAARIVNAAKLESESRFHDRIDRLRLFINTHSKFKIDDEFRANLGRPDRFADAILAHATGASTERAHMDCSSQSNLMALALRSLGYETRQVAVWDTHAGRVKGHAFLDVKNPATGEWETQDPLYNLYWRSKTGQRVSLADAAERLDDIEPCNEQACGWDIVSRDGVKAKKMTRFLDIISVKEADGRRFAVYTSRADLDQTYTHKNKHGRFCEIEPKRCKDGFFPISERQISP